ncbi:copper-binding protein [Erythrobacter longus]|nr:copper-binding protein [Erythrobacter longus]
MRYTTRLTLMVAPLMLAACDSNAEMGEHEGMTMDDSSMPGMHDGMEQGVTLKTASASGTVTAIDAEAGTVTIDHEAVPELEWPEMVMAFDATEEVRGDVAVGDTVTFEFSTGEEGNTVTSITVQ